MAGPLKKNFFLRLPLGPEIYVIELIFKPNLKKLLIQAGVPYYLLYIMSMTFLFFGFFFH